MGKLLNVVLHVDVRRCMVSTLYAMYVSMVNLRKSVIRCKFSMGRLVGVVSYDGVRGCIVCTLYVM